MRTQNGEEIHLKKTEGDAEEASHVKRANPQRRNINKNIRSRKNNDV